MPWSLHQRRVTYLAPSGKLIAFERILSLAEDEIDLRVIFVMDADGTNARQITQQGASSEEPNHPDDGGATFAPTGTLIAFNRRDPDTLSPPSSSSPWTA